MYPNSHGVLRRGAQDTEDDNDNSYAVKSDSEEDEPSSTSNPKPQPAKWMKRPKECDRWVRPILTWR